MVAGGFASNPTLGACACFRRLFAIRREYNSLPFPQWRVFGVFGVFLGHRCTPDAIPRHSAAVLRHHTDEVWFIAFSPSGQWLASASKDSTAAIWDVATRSVKHELVGHTDGRTSRIPA